MASGTTVVPIFPLPDVTFFPHTLLPLHVFEARYRAMIMDALARDRRLCVVKLKPGYEATYAGKPPVHPVAGVGEIVSWERLSNGRYNILVRGDARIRTACAALLRALERPADLLDTALAEGQPSGVVADRVAAAVIPDPALRQELLELLDVDARAERVADAVETLVRELKGGRS